MGSLRAKGPPPVGSARWVYDEREVAKQFVEQELEEFAFSARNEIDWLNERMAEVLNQNQFNIHEAFKTPGKLRGKTPRTARKPPPSVARAPLTDIFNSSTPRNASPSKSSVQKQTNRFHIALDKENEQYTQTSPPKNESTSQHPASPINKAAVPVGGYLNQDQAPLSSISSQIPAESAETEETTLRNAEASEPHKENNRDTDDSFVSATEDPATKANAAQATQETEVATQEEGRASFSSAKASNVPTNSARQSQSYSVSAETDVGMQEAAEHVERTSPAKEQVAENVSPRSDTPSPERPVLRKKSSLNLASLPPRDPLTTKRSIGPLGAQTASRESHRGASIIRDGTISRAKLPQGNDNLRTEVADEFAQSVKQAESQEETAHSPQPSHSPPKTSTQRLHERITMLGKTNTTRTSKSIATSVTFGQTTATEDALNEDASMKTGEDSRSEEDEWIDSERPMRPTQVEKNAVQPTETGSRAENKPEKLIATYPDLQGAAAESTTPAGSPARWVAEGPLSASKAKFQSFLRSARGMFASSAATSAQAKMEAMSPAPSRSKLDVKPGTTTDLQTGLTDPDNGPSTRAKKRSLSDFQDHTVEQNPPEEPPAKRRSSRLSDNAKAASKAPHPGPKEESTAVPEDVSAARRAGNDKVPNEPSELAGTEPSQKLHQKKPLKMTKASETQRLKQLPKSGGVQKTKPGQLSVLVPSMRPQPAAGSVHVKASLQSQQGSRTTSASSNARPQLSKKASDSSLRTASAQGTRPGAGNPKLKALESARRKKEQDEREQQRKEEQRKAQERRRAEKAEEERQIQEQRLIEQKREAEVRAAAHKRAVEQQREEKQQKAEQLRMQADAVVSKHGNEWMARSQQERSANLMNNKIDKAPTRAESKGPETGRPLVPHVNPAKPPKRYFNPDNDDQESEPASVQSFQPAQSIAKKQKVSEEFELRTQQQPLARTAMGAPMRASTAKKQELPSKFQTGYMTNASSGQQGPSSMLKTAINTSHQMQQQNFPNPKTPHTIQEIAKFSNARIPFAEAPNPPGPQTYQQQPARPFQKTPGTAKSVAKSSPSYPNGDNISLPDIATDSEDEDSDDTGFEAPAWTNSPELRQLLEQQQLVDPMRVFGPIAPLSMDEVFKGVSKDRLKRFRDRTSSANWNGPDRLTEEERRGDREARERFEREGGWTYEGNLELEKSHR